MILPAAALFALMWPVARPVVGVGDTFQFWYAGQLVASGASPYDQRLWHEAATAFGDAARNVADNCSDPRSSLCTWTYPPWTAWLFAPFGLLGPTFGALLLDAAVLATALGGTAAAVLIFGPRDPVSRSLMLAAAAVAHPLAITIRSGHFVGLLLLALLALAHGLRGRRAGSVAAGAVVLASKPHLFGALAVLTLAALVRQRAGRAIALTSAALVALVAVGVALYPEAIGAIAGSAGAKAGIAWATTWAFGGSLVPAAPVLGFGVLATLAAVLASVALRAAPAAERDAVVVAVGASLSLVIAPYTQPYDLLLLLPAAALTAASSEWLVAPARWTMLAATAALYGAGGWLAVALGHAQSTLTGLPGALPVLTIALLAIALALRQRAGQERWRTSAAQSSTTR